MKRFTLLTQTALWTFKAVSYKDFLERTRIKGGESNINGELKKVRERNIACIWGLSTVDNKIYIYDEFKKDVSYYILNLILYLSFYFVV